MAERAKNLSDEGAAEKGSRFFRNINILGAVALGGAAIIAPPAVAVPAAAWAGLNAVQAGGFEAARRFAKSRRLKRSKQG